MANKSGKSKRSKKNKPSRIKYNSVDKKRKNKVAKIKKEIKRLEHIKERNSESRVDKNIDSLQSTLKKYT